MKTICSILSYLSLTLFFVACRSKVFDQCNEQKAYGPQKEFNFAELNFHASIGPVSYEDGSCGWINTRGGSIQLNRVGVINGVSTDECLTAICSDIGYFWTKGGTWLENSQVHEFSNIGGNGRIERSTICGKLAVCGSLETIETKFFNTVEVKGNIRAEATHFEGTLCAAANLIQLNQSCTNDIFIYPSNDDFTPQVICLKNNTIIYGDICFTSMQGKVILDPTSHIYGQIYGGNIVPSCN